MPSNGRARAACAALVAAVLFATGCSSSSDSDDSTTSTAADPTTEVTESTGASASTIASSTDPAPSSTSTTAGQDDEAAPPLFDMTVVHDISVTFDQGDYDAMIEAYAANGDKEWIEATVTIDGVTYEQVGLRLKGNSSLSGLGGGAFPGVTPSSTTAPAAGDESASSSTDAPASSAPDSSAPDSSAPRGAAPGGFGPGGGASADEPESLPWLIRLDEFVKGQDHQGYEDIVVRSNGTETSLNEAVALDLLDAAGLASQDAAFARFAVNDGEPALRLAIEHPDDDMWQESAFTDAGALYKAESTGDWSYRGDDPTSYEEVFDQEGGSDVADLTPLIDFLKFLNESDDATFAAELPQRLDVDAFATYLAMMELVENFDDIDGPGNNAYLWYDVSTEQFTVVPWDMNLAFGTGMGGGMGEGGFPPGGTLPEGFELPEGVEIPEGMEIPTDGSIPEGFDMGDIPLGGNNILVERFHANAEFEALYQSKLSELRASLYDSGEAAELLAARVDTLSTHATDLVDEETITEEEESIATRFTGG